MILRQLMVTTIDFNDKCPSYDLLLLEIRACAIPHSHQRLKLSPRNEKALDQSKVGAQLLISAEL